MKTLYIIRHAKSDQGFFGNDFERPLNERGKKDAPMMAKRLADKKIELDALFSSPAIRAKKTAELFAETLGKPANETVLVSALYQASSDVFYEVIASLPGILNSVAIFSHNPGITHFVNSLGTEVQIDNMPTCAIFSIEINIADWSAFAGSKKEFLFFDYPKN